MTTASDLFNSLHLLDGVHLYVDPDGNLKGRGDQGHIARWLPEIRTHKAELIALLTEARRLWLVVRPDGTTTSHSLNPPATLAEMQDRGTPALRFTPSPNRSRIQRGTPHDPRIRLWKIGLRSRRAHDQGREADGNRPACR